jgi:hypothetical protein
VDANPTIQRKIIFQSSMARGTVIKLTNKLQEQLSTGIAADGKSHSIGGAIFGQARTTRSVTKIAKLVEFVWHRHGALVSGCTALAMPSATERQAGGMQPAAILQLANGHEKWTSHAELLVEIVQLYSEEICVASGGQPKRLRRTRGAL